MKISILTAVYNAAPYLPRCLDSLLAQTHQDFEAICIDDASTDDSLQILHDYAQRDARFRVIHQDTNIGQAKARNHGLEYTNGEFTMMLDADDWLAPDALQLICQSLQDNEQANCAIMRLVFWYNESKEHEFDCQTNGKKILSGKEAFLLCMEGKLHGLYAVRTSLHKQFPYDTTTRLYSDDNTTLLHYFYSQCLTLCEATYYYRIHNQSFTHRHDIHRLDRMEADLSLRQIISTCLPEALPKFENLRWLRVIDCYYYFHTYRSLFSETDRNHILQRFQSVLKETHPEWIRASLRYKFGYIPFSCFRLFLLQEELYFLLKRWKRTLLKRKKQP